MERLFRLRLVADRRERSLGIVCRLFGIDFTVMLVGYMNDWMLIDLRIPAQCGFYLQVLFLFVAVGKLSDDAIYRREG